MLKVIGAVVAIGAVVVIGAKVANRLWNKGERRTVDVLTGQGSRRRR